MCKQKIKIAYDNDCYRKLLFSSAVLIRFVRTSQATYAPEENQTIQDKVLVLTKLSNPPERFLRSQGSQNRVERRERKKRETRSGLGTSDNEDLF
jgi:hypothetical protein